MKVRVPPVVLERQQVIARVVDDDDGYTRVETWNAGRWQRADVELFLDVFHAREASPADLQAHNVAPLDTPPDAPPPDAPPPGA